MSRYRHEYKYMIDARQEGILMLKSRSLMQPDVHAGTDGRYMVRSLYLDDPEKFLRLGKRGGNGSPLEVPDSIL